MADKEVIEYTYYAPTEKERQEAEHIRRIYLSEKKTDKLSRMRELDKKVKTPPMIWSLSLGIIGTLIFGGGLAVIMEFDKLIIGSVLGLAGLIPIAIAYPVYKKILEKGKKKYGAEILTLADEILKE